jgi:adenylate cyclase
MERRLTAILSADVAGFTGLMEADEVGTLDALKADRSKVIEPQLAAHGGRVFKLMGDGLLVEFASVVSAVNCALAIQNAMAAENERRIRYRIGINLGDVMVDGSDIYGDGVNLAVRLQGLAPVGGIALSRTVTDHVRGKISCDFDDIGEHFVKNMNIPVHVFTVRSRQRVSPREVVASAERSKPSICVLPFTNMSEDPQQEYFSDGMTEDIITDLGKVSALSVIARNSAFALKGKPIDVPRIARQLNVSHVLEGSVRRVGGRVRITAQLIDGVRNDHVWAERYDRDLNDIFALQDEISHAIVDALKLKLLPEEKRAIEQRGTRSPEAYDLYLMARRLYLGDRFTTFFDLDALIRLCKNAIGIDPNYALAWAHLGLAQAVQFTTGRVSCDDGRAAAERALVLDPSLGEGHMAMARVLLNEDRVDEAHSAIETALRLDPESTDALWIAGLILRSMRKYREALRRLEYVVAHFPVGLVPAGMLMITYVDDGDREGAQNAAMRVTHIAEQVLEEHPNYGTAMGYSGLAYAILGEDERSREITERGLAVDPNNSTMKIFIVCARARWDVDAALALFAELTAAANLAQLRYFRRVAHHVIGADLRFQSTLDAAERRLAG